MPLSHSWTGQKQSFPPLLSPLQKPCPFLSPSLKDPSFHAPFATLTRSYCCPCNAATLRCRSARPCHRRLQTHPRLFSSSPAASALLCLRVSPAALSGSAGSLPPLHLPRGSHLPPHHPWLPQGDLGRATTARFLPSSSSDISQQGKW